MAFVIDPEEIEGWPLHEGIEGKVVVNGKNMTTLMGTWAPKTRFAVHIHPHEQIGICLKGEAVFHHRRQRIGGQEGRCLPHPFQRAPCGAK